MTCFSTPGVGTADAVPASAVETGTRPTRPSEHFEFTWRGRALRVVYHPAAFGTCADYEHIEVFAERGQPLPITETGYRSLFLARGSVEVGGGPVAFVTRWLDHKANTREWKQTDLQSRQGSLF